MVGVLLGSPHYGSYWLLMVRDQLERIDDLCSNWPNNSEYSQMADDGYLSWFRGKSSSFVVFNSDLVCKVPLNWRVSRASPAINTVAESSSHNCDFSVKGFWTILEFAEASKAPFTSGRCSQGSYDRLFSWLLVVDDHVCSTHRDHWWPCGAATPHWSWLWMRIWMSLHCFKPKMKLSRPVKIRFNWAIDKDSSLRSHTHTCKYVGYEDKDI